LICFINTNVSKKIEVKTLEKGIELKEDEFQIGIFEL
tara:strand:- start:1893 stop:2003 length:111 start_codon:yes stop_codon:yes gene_type:complete